MTEGAQLHAGSSGLSDGLRDPYLGLGRASDRGKLGEVHGTITSLWQHPVLDE